MTTKLRVSSLNYDDIRASLISYLQQQPEFTDMNFSASGLSVLIDMLSANAHYQSLMANFLANEIYLDTAVKRSSIVSRAKELGYTPYSVKAARAYVNLVASITTSPPTSLLIPANTQFTSKVNNQTYTFVTLQSYAANRDPATNTYTFNNIELFEGSYIVKKLTFNGIDPTYEINNPDIDTSTLRVFVQDATLGTNTEYLFAANMLDINSASKVFFLQEGFNGNYQIYFGDDVIGQAPTVGSVISLFFVASSGSAGNDATSFTLASTLSGFTNATSYCSIVQQSSGGRDRETVASIKLNAQNQFGVQNRAVVASDYKALILSSGVNVRSVHVWGGESNIPPKYGYVIVCVQPAIGDSLLQSQKILIQDLLKQKAVANINIEFQDPEYLDIALNTAVLYNKNTLSISTYDLEANVLASIMSYAISNVNRFDATFRYSQLMREIDRTDESVLSNDTMFTLKKQIVPRLFTDIYYKFSFSNGINNGLKAAAVSSTLFNVLDVATQVFIEDDSNGNLHLYSMIDGVKTTIRSKIGTINYNTGDLNIYNLNIVSYEGSYLTFTAYPSSNDIYGTNNIILRIQNANVNISSRADQ